MKESDRRYWAAVGERWAGTSHGLLWRRHCDAVSARLVERWLPRSTTARLLKTDLFDEALTTGLESQLRDRAGLVVGLDLSPAIAKEAAGRCPTLRCLQADVRRLPFADESFDAVVSLSTLDHFETEEDLARSLSEVSRVLRASGSLLLTMDNPTNPAIALRNLLPFSWLNRLGIVPYFVGATAGPHKLESLLKTAGFEVIDTTSVLHCLRVLAVPACHLIERAGHEGAQKGLLSLLLAAERFARLPTHHLSGNYLAVLARRAG
jgi:SAM-dependent methyltransferase